MHTKELVVTMPSFPDIQFSRKNSSTNLTAKIHIYTHTHMQRIFILIDQVPQNGET